MAAGSISYEDFKKAASYFIELSDRLCDSWQIQVTILAFETGELFRIHTSSSSVRVLHGVVATRHRSFTIPRHAQSRGCWPCCCSALSGGGDVEGRGLGCHFW